MSERQFLPKTLRGRLALSIGGAMLASLTVFGAVALAIATDEETVERADEPKDELERDARNQVMTTLALAAPLGVLLAVAGAYLLTRRAMRPVDDVIHAAAAMTADDLHRRLPAPRAPDELARLVEAVNGLFARLESGYAAQASFASHASHELRTPLAVIMAELEVASARPRTTAEWERSAAIALSETRKASRMVDALLRHARSSLDLRSGGKVDLRELVREVVVGHAAAALQAGIELSAVLPDGRQSPPLEGDSEALAAALGSVVGNALRYTPRGGQVCVRLDEDPQRAHSVHVDDTGPGVDAEELESIFTPFFRGAAGRKAEASGSTTGSGLGLSLARSIAEAHGGTLCVAVSPSGGARFTLELPGVEKARSVRPPASQALEAR